MTDYIDTREGWRETDLDSEAYPERAEVWVQFYDHGKSRRWVREEPVSPLPHDWRWGEIDGGNEPGRRVAVSVCWACEAVAWNEPDFLALDPRPCPGHPEVALVREAFAAHPEWFASDSARRQIAELLRVPT